MTALGFQSQESSNPSQLRKKKGPGASTSTSNLLDSIVGDGEVTLAEFIALVTGEVLGRNQHEEAQTVFAALCGSDGEGRHDNLVTLGKLEAACRKFEVSQFPKTLYFPLVVSSKNTLAQEFDTDDDYHDFPLKNSHRSL
jgi:hypothetical protein